MAPGNAAEAFRQTACSVDPAAMRRTIITQSRRADVGHIGSCLCVVEILAALYGRVLRVPSPDDADRDRFVLSKGHAALALYAVLAQKRWISAAQLDTFCGENSLLGVHPEAALPGVDFSTGSLGHGLSLACGAALAARMQHSSRRIFCLISDGECNEGSVWEAAMFAAHHRLDNLTVIVDVNGQQALGRTSDVQGSNLRQRWEAFGWRTNDADGHSIEALSDALRPAADSARGPLVVLARTVFGKGVSFMEQGVSPSRRQLAAHPINWHYLPMSADEFDMAMAEVTAAGDTR
jgi:transketolase